MGALLVEVIGVRWGMMRVQRLRGIEDVGREMWRALEPPEFPFFDFEFLHALEHSGSIGRRGGWSPAYLVCKEEARVLGALCLYLKTDSYGEYIFDWEWARAYQRYGLSCAFLPQRHFALRPLLGRCRARAQPAFRTVLLRGYRLRHRAGLRTPGGRRPGRAQAGARLPPFSHLQRSQDQRPDFRTRYRGVHPVGEGDAKRGHGRVRLPRSLQTLSRLF